MVELSSDEEPLISSPLIPTEDQTNSKAIHRHVFDHRQGTRPKETEIRRGRIWRRGTGKRSLRRGKRRRRRRRRRRQRARTNRSRRRTRSALGQLPELEHGTLRSELLTQLEGYRVARPRGDRSAPALRDAPPGWSAAPVLLEPRARTALQPALLPLRRRICAQLKACN
jgi:hypothetical protein